MLDKMIISLISPQGTALCFGVFAWVTALLGKKNLALLVGLFALSWLYFWSMPSTAQLLIKTLEKQYPPVNVDDLPVADAIVILGGGVFATGFADATQQPVNLTNAADRVWFGARLFHRGKAPLVVLSGGSAENSTGLSESEAMQLFLADLAVPSPAMLLENGSRNTRENAQFTAALVKNYEIKKVLLVTSAVHMDRALHHFVEQGIEVIAVPTDFDSGRLSGKYCCFPDGDTLDANGKAFKELLGQWVW
ncbi:MAG: YdcF family protein [Porticoccaceae bacterium]